MIIAIDYDGTIADTNSEKSRWIKEHLHRDVAPWDCDHTDCVPLIGETAYVEMCNVVYEKPSTMKASLVNGSSTAIEELAQSHTLYLLSARGNDRLAYAEENLERRGLHRFFTGFHTSSGSSKAAVCHHLGAHVLVDDDPRHLVDPDLADIVRVLIQAGRPEAPPLNDRVVFCADWTEVISTIGNIEEK